MSQEEEPAYARLRALRLPLAQRYPVHVLPRAELRQLLGGQVIGAAMGRCTLEGEAVRVDNVAFYLDGDLFFDGGD